MRWASGTPRRRMPINRQVRRAPAFLDDLVGQPLQRPVDLRGRHQLIFLDDSHWPNIVT